MSAPVTEPRPFTIAHDAGPGLVVVLTAPSGTGKSTVGGALLERRPTLGRCITATTRAPRPGETDGVDYHFVSEEEFARMRDGGELLEWAEVHGRLYGPPKRAVEERRAQGLDTLLIIDVQGGPHVKRILADAVLIFLLPPSAEELARRLHERGTDGVDAIARRQEDAVGELQGAAQYDYVVVNDDVERAIATIDAILTAEHARAGRTRIQWPGA